MTFTSCFIKKLWISLDSAAPMLTANCNSTQKFLLIFKCVLNIYMLINKEKNEGRSVAFSPRVCSYKHAFSN